MKHQNQLAPWNHSRFDSHLTGTHAWNILLKATSASSSIDSEAKRHRQDNCPKISSHILFNTYCLPRCRTNQALLAR
jgi:hypothetical protein